jgi:hypothetical protein
VGAWRCRSHFQVKDVHPIKRELEVKTVRDCELYKTFCAERFVPDSLAAIPKLGLDLTFFSLCVAGLNTLNRKLHGSI